MVLNPEVLAKAQAEIDAVVGRERPPSFKDMADLPYIRAMVKETLRWRPVVPLGKCAGQVGFTLYYAKPSTAGLAHMATEVSSRVDIARRV
jgi:hypothetical protein